MNLLIKPIIDSHTDGEADLFNDGEIVHSRDTDLPAVLNEDEMLDYKHFPVTFEKYGCISCSYDKAVKLRQYMKETFKS
jgi:hypothetical protein